MEEERGSGCWFLGVLGAEEGDKELMLASGIREGLAVDVDHLERGRWGFRRSRIELWAVEE